MQKLGFGIIGCGGISSAHAEAIASLEQAKLIAVADPVESKAHQLAEKYGVPYYLDYHELLQLPEVKIVNICTPSGLHAQVGIDAARAGKHIIVEKPIDTTLKKADQFIQVCRENKVKLTVIFQNRFNANLRKLKETIKEGKMGKLILGGAYVPWYRTQEYYNETNWRGTIALDGGASLINQSIHTIDLLVWMMGEVQSLFAYTGQFAHQIEGEDLGVAILRFRNGALGIIAGSTDIYPGFPERLEVYGENGSVIVEGGNVKTWEFKSTVPIPQEEKIAISGAADHQKMQPGHQAQIADMIAAINEGRPPFVTGEEGRRALEVIRAIYRSAQLKKEISLPLKEE